MKSLTQKNCEGSHMTYMTLAECRDALDFWQTTAYIIAILYLYTMAYISGRLWGPDLERAGQILLVGFLCLSILGAVMSYMFGIGIYRGPNPLWITPWFISLVLLGAFSVFSWGDFNKHYPKS